MKRRLIELILVMLVALPIYFLSSVSKADAGGKKEKVATAYDDIEIYSQKYYTGKYLETVYIETLLTVLEKDENWIKIQTPSGTVGWVKEDLVKNYIAGKTEKVYTITDDLYIWSKKKYEGESIVNVNFGTPLTVLKKDGDWIKIQTPSGKIGWTNKAWVTNDISKRIRDLEAEVKPIPASDVEKNLIIYKELSKLDPTNKKYKEKVKYYSSKLRDKERSGIPSCYDLGYRYGKCATKAMKGIPCDPENDIIIPARCRGKKETQRGIDAGVRSVY